MRTFSRTECPGKNRKRGQRKLFTVENMLVVIEDTDIVVMPQEEFVCPSLAADAKDAARRKANVGYKRQMKERGDYKVFQFYDYILKHNEVQDARNFRT
jgi:hypothetical protein